jgi:hypothetical protein
MTPPTMMKPNLHSNEDEDEDEDEDPTMMKPNRHSEEDEDEADDTTMTIASHPPFLHRPKQEAQEEDYEDEAEDDTTIQHARQDDNDCEDLTTIAVQSSQTSHPPLLYEDANENRHQEDSINEILKKIIADLAEDLAEAIQAFKEINNSMTRMTSILRRRRLTLKQIHFPPPKTHDPLPQPRPHATSTTNKNPPFLRREAVTPVPTMATQLQLQPKQTDDETTATIAANARRHNQLRPKPIHWMFPPLRTHNRRL